MFCTLAHLHEDSSGSIHTPHQQSQVPMQLDVYNAYADCSHQVMRDERTYKYEILNYVTRSQPHAKAPTTLV